MTRGPKQSKAKQSDKEGVLTLKGRDVRASVIEHLGDLPKIRSVWGWEVEIVHIDVQVQVESEI